MKRLIPALALALIFLTSMSAAIFAYTSSKVAFTFPTDNPLWLSSDKSHNASLTYVSINDCSETTATQNSLNSMGSQTMSSSVHAYFSDLPSPGWAPTVTRCDGTTGSTIDVKLDFLDCDSWNAAEGIPYGTDCNGGSNYLGHVYARDPASSSWCSLWSAAWPCGDSTIYVRYNKVRWDTRGADPTNYPNYQSRVTTHEFGHVAGFADYCATSSISNQGTSGCPSSGFLYQIYTTDDEDTLSVMNHR